MRFSAIAGLGILVAALPAIAQSSATPVEIEKEPHHTLLLENSEARVFRLVLEPKEATLLHRHRGVYAFVSLSDVTLQNEVPEQKPVPTTLTTGNVHTFNSAFTLVERNISSTRAVIIVVERVGSPAAPFASLLADFKVHDTVSEQLFEESSMRGYRLQMAAGGRTDDHDENWDRLIVAITDAHLQDRLNDESKREIVLKAGEVEWIPKNTDRAIRNIGNGACSLVVIEFN